MELEQLRQALLRLNELHQKAALTKNLRKSRGKESGRQTGRAVELLDSEQVTIDDVHREIAVIEEQVPEWKVRYYKKRGTYVLIPRVTQAL